MRIDGARILVTGASSGIGREIATNLANRGARLAISGRDQKRLLATAKKIARPSREPASLPADLSLLKEIPLLLDRTEQSLGGLDAVVHAAGINAFGSFADTTPEDLEQIVRTNLLATMEIARVAIPRFEAQKRGSLVFVGSIFGSIGFPWFTAYSATKFAVRGFAESLRREVSGQGIQVAYVAPRGTRTAMSRQYAKMAEATKMPLDPPEKVARQVVRALERGRPETFLGGAERLFVRLNGLLPRLVDRAIVKERDKMAPYVTPRKNHEEI